MTGVAGASKPCPLCGGQLMVQLATIPFVVGKTITAIKDVPAEVCEGCGEPFLHAEATDSVTSLLDLRSRGCRRLGKVHSHRR